MSFIGEGADTPGTILRGSPPRAEQDTLRSSEEGPSILELGRRAVHKLEEGPHTTAEEATSR